MQRQGVEHGSLQKLTPTRAAFARPGPGMTLFPDVIAPMQPSDSLPPSTTAPVPLACGLPRGERFFCATWADDTCARRRAVRRRRVTGSPSHRNFFEERRGPPRLRGRPLRACYGRTPRRIQPPPRPMCAGGRCCLRSNPALSASGKSIGFGAAVPWPARSHTYASPMPFLTPSQGLLPVRAGSPLTGRDSHPLDDARSFMVASHPPIPFDQSCLVALECLYVWLT